MMSASKQRQLDMKVAPKGKKQLYYISIIDNNRVENKKEVLLDMGLMI